MSKKTPDILTGLDLLQTKTGAGKVKPEEMIPVQEAMVIQGVLQGKRPAQAVMDAGYGFNKKNAAKFGEQIVKKHTDTNGALVLALDKVGVSLEAVAEKIKDGLGATKPILIAKKKDKDTGSEELRYGEAEDHATRHKFIETVLDILPNARAAKKVEITQTTFEQKAVLVADIRENPQATLEMMQKALERKRLTQG